MRDENARPTQSCKLYHYPALMEIDSLLQSCDKGRDFRAGNDFNAERIP